MGDMSGLSMTDMLMGIRFSMNGFAVSASAYLRRKNQRINTARTAGRKWTVMKMRMIDAETLTKSINEMPVLCHDPGWVKAAVLLTIDNIPTIQPDAPRVMTLEEVVSTGPEDVNGIVEIKEEEHMYGCYMRRYDEINVELSCDVPDLPEKLVKGCARIWTARPTEEQRKAVKWDGQTD